MTNPRKDLDRSLQWANKKDPMLRNSKHLGLAMLPRDFPKEFLWPEQLTDIQDAVMDEPWRPGWEEEEAQSDPAEAESGEEGAVSKSSSSQDNGQKINVSADEVIPSTKELEELAEDLNLMRTVSNSEDLMLSDFEEHTGKDE
ncbi:unnamed protein product [Ceratitis capitata]|uniref:(Mediterranean fruit fly) hypothetical protein n=1 Tax=Ceratitis capitata TaxID=7213 RepID=A0A811U9E8_CERCA|nr:unnamed protein product [Ceratitis capitata]